MFAGLAIQHQRSPSQGSAMTMEMTERLVEIKRTISPVQAHYTIAAPPPVAEPERIILEAEVG